MLKENFKKSLKLIAKNLNEAGIEWKLIGSASLTLQGMDFEPHDIDILIAFSNKERVEKLFFDYQILGTTKLSNGEGEETRYLIEEVETQFCFEYKNGFYIKFEDKIEIDLDGGKIYCNKLENEEKAYRYLGRNEKADKIKKFINCS